MKNYIAEYKNGTSSIRITAPNIYLARKMAILELPEETIELVYEV